jgi:hypothetical protein
MSVFGNIVSAIFGSKHAADVTAAAGPSAPSPPTATAAGAAAPSAATSAGLAAAKPISKADVEAILAKLADEQDEDYDWKKSIVDLMKLLKLETTGQGARLHGRARWVGGNERMAAQAGDGKARRDWRQSAGQSQSISDTYLLGGIVQPEGRALGCDHWSRGQVWEPFSSEISRDQWIIGPADKGV